jgi:hypothetical protein
VGGRQTDEWSLVVYVTRKLPAAALRSNECIPHELRTREGTVLTDVVERAEPRFGVDTGTYRPLRGGCQIMSGYEWLVPAFGGCGGARMRDVLAREAPSGSYTATAGTI